MYDDQQEQRENKKTIEQLFVMCMLKPVAVRVCNVNAMSDAM